MTGINMQHVPYRGSAPAMQDLLSNRVQVMFDNPTTAGRSPT
jgi:tripartite-type tricarboxylate transporter receptor subunit TctC